MKLIELSGPRDYFSVSVDGSNVYVYCLIQPTSCEGALSPYEALQIAAALTAAAQEASTEEVEP